MFSLRNKKNFLVIILNTPSYLEFWFKPLEVFLFRTTSLNHQMTLESSKFELWVYILNAINDTSIQL